MRLAPRWFVAPAVALVAVSGAACSSSDANAIAVRSTKTACDIAKTDLAAGKLSFEVKNDGSDPTELYVLGEGDRVISEVENIGPGTSRTLSVNLKAGKYTLACKPGQTGDGIKQAITVTGSGGTEGAAGKAADGESEVDAHEYAFSFHQPPAFSAGDAIKFELNNGGKESHEFEVLGPDGNAVGEIAEVAPGKTGEATLELEHAGTYTYQCEVKAADGQPHSSKGMKGTFTVT
ncbi:MAG: cupredoxin domain-containing protein [Actinobacteria bacterium]|nr:cupredoxin domain-containing protein [Actinomycetota bacterium]MBV9254493.1 cupredoxin domain-containing protein [Actinomycetota bacterium]